MSVNLLRTFFSHRVQLLCQQASTMWMYSRPSCLGRPFSDMLGEMEINTWIHRALAHGVNLNPRAGPAPLREGVDNTKVSSFTFIFGSLCNLVCSWCSHLPARSHIRS
jgi:hypothetical protein